MTSDLTSDHVSIAIGGFRVRLEELQRTMDPFVDHYEAMTRIDTDEDERLHKALAMVWSAWWDITDTIAFLRAADSRLRRISGSDAIDAETES